MTNWSKRRRYLFILFCLLLVLPIMDTKIANNIPYNNDDFLGIQFNDSIPGSDLSANAPAAPVLTIPDDDALLHYNQFSLYWNQVSEADYYTIVVDDNSDFSSYEILGVVEHQEGTSYNSYAIEYLPDGNYYWRVLAYGTVGSPWSEVRTFSIDTAPPDAPILSYIAQAGSTNDTTPTCGWLDPGDETITRYNVWLDVHPDFTNPVKDFTSDLSYTWTTPLVDDYYFWRVQAEKGSGIAGPWSETFLFEIDTTPPDTPVLLSPTNNSFTYDLSPLLDWEPTPGARRYYIEIDDNNDFSSPIVTDMKSYSQYVKLLGIGTYYWRVRASDLIPNYGPWSEIWYFEIKLPIPGKLTPITPLNNTITSDSTPYLNWTVDSIATAYNLQFDNNEDFSSPIYNVTMLASYYVIPSPRPDGHYYWRVRGGDGMGSWGVWSSTNNLTIDTAVPVIVNVGHSSNPNDAKPVIFYCDASDSSELSSVQLFYKLNDGIWESIPMIYVMGKTYKISLGPFDYNDEVIYYFAANDTAIIANEAIEDDGGSNYSFIVSSSDIFGPDIYNSYHFPSQPQDIDIVTCGVTIVDESDIQTAELYFRINGGSFTPISLTLVSRSKYEVDIGPFTTGDLIEYYFYAEDNGPNHNFTIEDNMGSYFNFTITAYDTSGPLIEDIEQYPSSPFDTDQIVINCTVTDPSDILDVVLTHRTDGGVWLSYGMTEVASDVYEFVIGPFTYGSIVEYYIYAYDNSTQHNLATDDNLGSYYGIIVSTNDSTGPTITDIGHSANPTEGITVSITCTISDSSGVLNASISYKVNSEPWTSSSMSLVSGNTWIATIGPFSANDFIEYYITAYDNSPVNNPTVDTNSGAFYGFTVQQQTTDTSPAYYLIPILSVMVLATYLKRKKQ